MNGLHRTICVALMLSSVLVGGQVLAAKGEREVAVEINKANELLRKGDVDAAVKAYGQVQNGAPDRADLSYNMAVAQYRKGDVAAAEKLFNQVTISEDDGLAAKARFNLGNCNYAAALRSADTDHPAAIKGLEKAIENYRSALEIDANDADSRANIELASAMIDKLREQDKKKQQQQQQQQQDQKQQQNKDQKDQKDQKQENSKQQDKQEKKDSQQQQGKDQQQSQQNQQQKPESSQEKKSQGKQGSKDQEQKKDEKSKDQSGDKSESKPQEQKSEQKDSKSPSSDSKSQSQEQSKANSADQKQPSKAENQSQPAQDKPADQSQQRQSQTPTKQKPKDQQAEKDEAKQSEQAKDQKGSGAPTGTLSAADQKSGKAEKERELAGQPEIVPEGAMTAQEAEKMLQAIRDQELIRRLKRQAAERNQHVPVDRDW